MDFTKSAAFMIIFVFDVCMNEVNAFSTIDDAYHLHTDLFSHYNKNVRPIYQQDSPVNVSIVMYIKTIQELDEVNERFSFGAALWISWQDYKLKWNVSDYNGLSSITVSYDYIWIPEIILSSPSKRITPLGRSSDRIRVENTGYVVWMPAALVESTCAVNMKRYPFDTQCCTANFTSLGYTNTEVLLNSLLPKIKLDVYSPNAMWDMTDSDITAKPLGTGGASELMFTIFLKRKSAFVVINIIIPILLLSMVNMFVFLLAPESGERVGYCITTLLAIAVYMTIVSDLLPQNPEPIPLISYKLFADLLISVLIVLCTILNIRIYHKSAEHKVPCLLQSMFRKLYRLKHVEALASVTDNHTETQNEGMKAIDDKIDDTENGNQTSEDLQITWKNISYMLDWIALLTFILLNVLNFLAFIITALQ